MSLGCLESPASVSVIAMHGMRFVSGQGAFTRFPGAPLAPTAKGNPRRILCGSLSGMEKGADPWIADFRAGTVRHEGAVRPGP